MAERPQTNPTWLSTLRVANIGLANLLAIANGGLLAYLVTAWLPVTYVLEPTSSTGLWLVFALLGVVISTLAGVALGALVEALDRRALLDLPRSSRRRWAKRLGFATCTAVVLGGLIGSVELYVYRPDGEPGATVGAGSTV